MQRLQRPPLLKADKDYSYIHFSYMLCFLSPFDVMVFFFREFEKMSQLQGETEKKLNEGFNGH